MTDRDIFDEEYDKLENEQKSAQAQYVDEWYAQQPKSDKTNGNKPLYITLICFALLLCIALGWVLCTVFGGGRSTEEQLLSKVLSVLNNDYYKEVSDVDMWKGIEDAGTALLQTAGDRYSRLMSPATYYSYNNPKSSIGDDKGLFGVSFQIVEGIGLYVSEVMTNSNSYGALQAGDMVVKMSNLNDGQGVTVGKVTYNEINLSDLNAQTVQDILDLTDFAEFSALRNGEIYKYTIARGKIDYVNSKYPYEFVEFYFDDKYTNVSLTHGTTGPKTSVKEERLLERLAEIPEAGYVRIDQFMNTNTDIDTDGTNALKEFIAVMELFKKRNLKYLILDLKGNPGGRVDYVSDIAGMLITDSKLTYAQQNSLRDRNGNLLITTLESRAFGNESHTAKPAYEQYFGELKDKPSIVVWTDGGSASASELLTGALTDYGTAVQMGTRTFGKGIAQICMPLDDYEGTFVLDGKKITYPWAIYYTVAEYFSPVTHANIHGTGYVPSDPYNGLDTYDKLWTATVGNFSR